MLRSTLQPPNDPKNAQKNRAYFCSATPCRGCAAQMSKKIAPAARFRGLRPRAQTLVRTRILTPHLPESVPQGNGVGGGCQPALRGSRKAPLDPIHQWGRSSRSVGGGFISKGGLSDATGILWKSHKTMISPNPKCENRNPLRLRAGKGVLS